MCVFFFNDTATTEIYTLSLHDALPILAALRDRDQRLVQQLHPRLAPLLGFLRRRDREQRADLVRIAFEFHRMRSEEHTSELQSRQYLVCRLLLEKKKNKHT